jgi:PAS domain S-box-containing protein
MDEAYASKNGHASSTAASEHVASLWHAQAATILERITDGFIALDNQWRYIYVNHQPAALLGKRQEELLGKSMWEIFPEIVDTRFSDKYHEAMATQQPVTVEKYYPHSQRWYSLRIYPSPGGLSIFYNNITKRKLFEGRLILLASIAQSISDAVIATDMQHTILCWNKAAEALYGWTQEEVLGKSANDILSFESPNNPPDEWREQVMSRGKWQGEVIHRRKDGTFVNILASASLVKDSNNTILGMVAANRDITEWKELELRKDEFIGAASHELRTPVTTVKGYAQMLQRKFRKQGLHDYADILGRIDGQLNRITKLIVDLLDVSKMRMGTLAYSKGAFDFDTWLRSLLDDLQQVSDQHVIILTGGVSSNVIGDQNRLAQVFINLVTNAIKYSPDAERVDVEIASERDTVIVRVRDYGVGIPREQRHKIFDRFYRTTSVSPNTFPGLGIGLYISREIIQAHNGKIWVEGEEGEGSTFCVSLPLEPEK